ncbi:P-loop containing nucleoside triphosphate hydrolase protein, partial [Dendrothele bispora CBS 962.96]
VRELVYKKTGKRACLWQIKTALALYHGKDVVGVARTGAGKTLSFWIPLLMALEDGLKKTAVVVTPLNLLGKQNAIQLNGGDIVSGKYDVVIINPELMTEEPCKSIWTNPKFTSMLMFGNDEGHCVSQWGRTFRNHYLNIGIIRYIVSNSIPFFVASATLPRTILKDVTELL